jgi:S1-C subfamily serine protease
MELIMKKLLSVILAVSVFILSAFSVSAEDVPQAVLDAANGVVRIYSYNNDYEVAGIASGFVIAREGDVHYIITNSHAVTYTYNGGFYMCDNVTIVDKSFDDGKGLIHVALSDITFFVGQEGNRLDLVMLKVEDSRLSERSILPLRRTDELGVGNAVDTLGFPGIADDITVGGDDLPSTPGDVTLTDGIVSKLNATMVQTEESEDEIVIQHTAQINGGNSGGPLLDKTGAVVGVNTWSTAEVSGLFFSGVSDYIIDNATSMGINITIAEGNAAGATTTAATTAATTTAAQTVAQTAPQAGETIIPVTESPYDNPVVVRNGLIIGIVIFVIIAIVVAIIAAAVSANKRRGEADKDSGDNGTFDEGPGERITPKSECTEVVFPSSSSNDSGGHTAPVRATSMQTAPVNRPYTPPAPPPPRRTAVKGLAGVFSGRDFALEDNSVMTFGRRPQNNVCFPADTEGVSGDHCELRKKGNYVAVVDKNSSYGTYVNKNKIAPNTEVRLNEGDRIELGSEKQAFTIKTR